MQCHPPIKQARIKSCALKHAITFITSFLSICHYYHCSSATITTGSKYPSLPPVLGGVRFILMMIGWGITVGSRTGCSCHKTKKKKKKQG
jgi:hypothetical protein